MKIVMKNYYVHKSARNELINLFDNKYHGLLRELIYGLDGLLNYQVIKLDTINHKLSFIQSNDWDTSNEPIVGDSFVYDLSTEWKKGYVLSDIPHKKVNGRKNNPQIYHNKWQFVSDDYTGFDVAASKERTKLWNSIPNIDKKRIGNKNYWVELLKENNIEI